MLALEWEPQKLTCLRLAETFLIHDLDLQCRFHYALKDSKSHAVERVMSVLNEAVGDSHFISPPIKKLTEAYSEEQLFTMKSDEVKQAQEQLH